MSKYLRPGLFILAFLLLWSFFNSDRNSTVQDDIILELDTKTSIGKVVTVNIINNSNQTVTLPSNCPSNPLVVERYVNGDWTPVSAETDSNACREETIEIPSEENYLISYAPWNAELFSEMGRYKISLETQLGEDQKTYFREVEIGSRSIFSVIWQEAFYKPIFNTLIYLIGVVPGNNLGWAIILLTIIIKLLLLIPNQKALKSQKQMQKIQPQLDAIKKKYKDDPKRMTEESMKIWQKHKVSPMGSCLPMLIQFPILIALFYVVRNGFEFINPQLLYAGLKSFDSQIIEPNFLGLIDLTKVNVIALPIIIGGLQFIQLKLSLGRNLKNQTGNANTLMMNKAMIYFMPLMIAFFTTTLPAAVAFYWGTSTLFGIGQQFFVNRSKD